MTWTSPMYPKLYSNDTSINPLGRPITSDEDGWIGSLVNIGAMLGPIPFGYISERFGRKIGLLSIAIPHCISYITMAFARTVWLFYFGRLLGGLAIGGGYTLLPMYITEITDDSNRGIYSVTLGIFWSFGSFIPYATGPFVSARWFNLLLACFPVMFFLAFLVFGTETPYYLVGIQKISQAEEVLLHLRSSEDRKGVKEELKDILNALKKEEQGKLSDIFTNPGLRKALMISVLLIVFMQLSGATAVGFYLQTIFEASGSSLPSNICSLMTGAFLLLFSFFVPFTVEKFGRKTLLIFSSIGMSLGSVLMGGFFFVKNNTSLSMEPVFWLPIASLILSTFSVQMGLGIIPWTISSEMFPKNVKQISAAATSTACWISTFLITKFFNNIVDLFGMAETFWIFSIITLLCAVFTFVCVPETKGKTLAQIQDILQDKK